MATCLQFALSNPTPGKEAEYNEWYGMHHLFTGVTTPGILAGQRFQRVHGPWPAGRHGYMALWELDDPPYALEQLALVKGTEKMPLSDAIDMAGIQPPTMWLRASVRNSGRIATNSSSRKTCVFMLANPRAGEDAQFEKSLLSGELAALADLSGVLSADFLTLADEQIRGNARKYRFGLLLELFEEDKGIENLAAILGRIPHLDPDSWQAPVFRPLGERVTTADAREHLRA